jgi:hypothetical protein
LQAYADRPSKKVEENDEPTALVIKKLKGGGGSAEGTVGDDLDVNATTDRPCDPPLL